MNLDQIAGVAHQPDGIPEGVVLLTHGAGGNRDSELLQRVCDEWAHRGWLAIRYNLPYRRRRPTGPPSGSAATDRAGIDEAIALCRNLTEGPLIVGGHSYGGRQTSMVIAETSPVRVGVLTLFSYPVHPPGKPDRRRTEHLPDIAVPTVFTHGTSDPFGTPDEVYRQCRERIGIFGPGGGFVFNAIHNIQGPTPLENMLALFRAVRDSARG